MDLVESSPLLPPSPAVVASVRREVFYGASVAVEKALLEQDRLKQSWRRDDQTSEKFMIRSLSKRSVSIFLICSVGSFCTGCVFSVLAPFYPKEATLKGVSDTMVGIIFSVFQVMFLFTSPIFGNNIDRLGAKFVYISGMFVAGGCVILFGFLDKCPRGTPFIALSLSCRCVQAIGMSALLTAGFSIASSEFPKHVATVLAALETCEAVGMMSGPVIGGALYQIGGFGLPFFIIGGICLVNVALISFILPPPKAVEVRNQRSVKTLLRSSVALLCFVNIFGIGMGLTFLEPTLANHLDKFHLSPFLIGLMFAIMPCLNGTMAPLWGYISDTKNIQAPLIIMGNLGCCLGMLFIGPCPWLPFLPFELWTVILGLFFYGFSFGSIWIPCIKFLAVGAFELGFEESLETYGIVSGLCISSFSCGAFLGPLIGGAFAETIGFRPGVTVVAAIYFSSMIVMITHTLYRKHKRRQSSKPKSVINGWKQNGTVSYSVTRT